MLAVKDLTRYDYKLPTELIATEPVSPRDSSRLFVYDTSTDIVVFDIFKNVSKYLPQGSLMVFNDTKVLPARLFLTKETGGKVQVLLAINELRAGDTLLRGIVDRRIDIGDRLYFEQGEYLEVMRQEEQSFYFSLRVPVSELLSLLMREGRTPIPPYIKDIKLSEDELRTRYQSILAKDGTSIAAPTASLHFTDDVLTSLEKQEIERTTVTLHVGAGTFAPLSEENFRTNTLFTEYCSVTTKTAECVNRAIHDGRTVIPVGSTALRTLESFATTDGLLASGDRGTDIFIYPPYTFKIASGLITNFHVPKSSLMLLVDAFLKHKRTRRDIMDLYTIAIREKFRFYSFGDAMLIL